MALSAMAFWTSSTDSGLAGIDASVDPAEILGSDYSVVSSNAKSHGLVAVSSDGRRYDFDSDTNEQFDERRRRVMAAAAKAGVADDS
jgi:hypothetical protein